ncbi:ParA family protein [Desulfothermus naphthae]
MVIIECPKCKHKHKIPDEKVPITPKIARCKLCGHRFPLNLKQNDSSVRKLGVCISKGGVGKTTTAVNIAAGLALGGYKVLLVDTDTQGQCSFLLGVKPPAGLTELVLEELPPEKCLYKARENLYLLAGGRGLAGVKRLIDREYFGGERTLSEALEKIHKDFDYVIVDTSPGWDALSVNVMFYVNEALIPVSLEIMTIQALANFLKTIAGIQKYRPEFEVKYIVPTFFDLRVKKKTTAMLEKLKSLYPDKICDPIRYNNLLSQAPMYGKTIFEYAPGSKGAQDYKKLVKRISNNPELFK